MKFSNTMMAVMGAIALTFAGCKYDDAAEGDALAGKLFKQFRETFGFFLKIHGDNLKSVAARRKRGSTGKLPVPAEVYA